MGNEGMGRTADLGPGFLRRIRTATLILGTLGVLYLVLYGGMRAGAAAAAGLAISLVNFRLLERIFSRMLAGPAGAPRDAAPSGAGMRGALLAVALLGKFLVPFAGTILALGVLRLPAGWFLAGFSLLLAVIVLKAFGILLTAPRSRRHPGRLPALLFAAVLLAGIVAAPIAIAASETGGASETERTNETVGAGAPGAATTVEQGHSPAAAGAAGATGAVEGAGSHEEKGGEAKHEGSEQPELPNIIHILFLLNPDAPWAAWLYKWQNPLYSAIVILLMCTVAIAAYRRRKMIPDGLQNVVEMIVESFDNFIVGIMGPRGREFVPFLGTLFLYIMLNNLQGLVPFLKAPTSVFNQTIALAICVFLYVQWTGLRKLGIWGYFHHMMGQPRDVIGWCMVPLMLPLHLIEEIARPVSLSLRLFGNILGEDVLLGVFAGLGVAMLGFMHLPIGVPLHLPFIFLAILMSTIQALVFTLLATIYFSQMLPHEEHEEEEH